MLNPAILNYIAEQNGELEPPEGMLALLSGLREAEFPNGAPLEPALLVNGSYWRAGDLFRRTGSMFQGATLWGLVQFVRLDPAGLWAIGFQSDRQKIIRLRMDLRISEAGLRVATLPSRGPEGRLIPPSIIKI